MAQSFRDELHALEEAADTEKLFSTNENGYNPTIPDKTATPARVREYLFEALRRRGVETSQAESITARWTVGTGMELREYPIEMYCSIFGADEDVWAGYMAVKGQLYREKPTKKLMGITLKVFGGMLSLIFTSVCVLALIWTTSTPNAGLRFAAGLAIIPAVLVNLIALAGICSLDLDLPNNDPDEQAASELRRYMESRDKKNKDKP